MSEKEDDLTHSKEQKEIVHHCFYVTVTNFDSETGFKKFLYINVLESCKYWLEGHFRVILTPFNLNRDYIVLSSGVLKGLWAICFSTA